MHTIWTNEYNVQHVNLEAQLQPDMQKDNFFTQIWFEPKIFYPKKCVNYDKSNLRQNSVTGPKDPNSAKK